MTSPDDRAGSAAVDPASAGGPVESRSNAGPPAHPAPWAAPSPTGAADGEHREPAETPTGPDTDGGVADGTAAVPPARTLRTLARRTARIAAEGLTRFVELTLVAIGLFGLFGDWEIEDVELLLWFDLVAIVYLTVGLVVVRRQRRPTPVDRAVLRQRLRFDLLFSVTAALIGLYSAVTVAESDPDPEYAQALTAVGVLTVALSWLLLHAGHARHYRNLYARIGGGLEWPVPTPNPARPPTERPTPRQIDFVYFAYTIGTSFGASDVLVTERRMRWSVLLHSCLSFFFNAAVLAFLISRLSSM